MSRPLRIAYPGAYYHIMNRGRAHQRVYRNEVDWRLSKDKQLRKRLDEIKNHILNRQS